MNSTITYRNYKYLLSLLPPVLVIYGNLMGGYFVWTNLVFTFGVIALLELVLPDDTDNSYDESDTIPNLILACHVLIQPLAIGSLLYSVYVGKLMEWSLLGAIISTGTNTGSSSIVVAHELLHRRSKLWQACSKFLLGTASNPYFFAEHIPVHHRYIGTTQDPATARYGESLYSFFLRTMVQQYNSVLNIEAVRLRKLKVEPYSWRNYGVGAPLVYVLVAIGIGIALGPIAVLAYITQGVLASFLLEYTNYIEHYGLSRSQMARVDETHSWQSDKPASRYLLIDLSRHADHHFHGAKPYHKLKTYENGPKLPAGYAGMFYLALLPPLWFSVMNPRVQAYQQQLNPQLA